MKNTFFIIVILFISLSTQAQWEFNYFVLKGGFSNQIMNPLPSSSQGLYLNTFEGELQLLPDTTFNFSYNYGYVAGADFHFDWHNDKGGFIIGAEYLNYSWTNKFITSQYDYFLYRTYTVHSVSFPVLMKFGYEIFNYQRYAFIGMRLNFNLRMNITEEVSWTSVLKKQTAPDQYLNQYNYVLVAGFNFLFFNFEFDYFLSNFLNQEYKINVGTDNQPYFVYPFSDYANHFFLINTSLYIPLSPWSSTRSYFLNKLLKLFK